MKKSKFLIALLILTMLLCPLAAAEAAEGEIKVVLNGAEIEFDVAPQIIDDRTMVPMRAIFEALGADVYWVDDYLLSNDQMILAVKDEVKILMAIGDEYMLKYTGRDTKQLWWGSFDDMATILDVPPQLVGGRTLVPLRAVSEALGINVDWIEAEGTVVLTCDEAFIKNADTDKSSHEKFFELFETPKGEIIEGYNDIRVYETDYTVEYKATLNAMFDNKWTVASVEDRFEENDGYVCGCGFDGRSQQFIEWTIEYKDGNGDAREFVMSNRTGLAWQIEGHIENYIAEYYKENFYNVYLKDVPLAESSYVFCFLVSYTDYQNLDKMDETDIYRENLETPEGTICLSKLTPANAFRMFPIYLSIGVTLDGVAASHKQELEESMMAKIEEMIKAMNEFTDGSLNARVIMGYHHLEDLHTGNRDLRWHILKGEQAGGLTDKDLFDAYKGVFW